MVWYGYGYGKKWYGMVLYGMAWYGYGMVWHDMYGTVWYGRVGYRVARYGTGPHRPCSGGERPRLCQWLPRPCFSPRRLQGCSGRQHIRMAITDFAMKYNKNTETQTHRHTGEGRKHA